MRRFALILALGALLSGCGSVSVLPPINVSHAPPAPPPVPPPACPADALSDILPLPPLVTAAGFPAAATPEESIAVTLYLEWLHALVAHDKAGWSRLARIKAACAAH